MTTNPWTEKKRIFWKDDPEFTKFNDRLYNDMWTFEETCDIARFNNFIFKIDVDSFKNQMKQDWFEYIKEWNRLENINEAEKIKGFAALTYFFIVLPFKELDNPGKYFTHFEINNINVAYFYDTNGDYLPFDGLNELFDSGPIHPAVYGEWLDRKYNSASWWISYMVFEKNNGLAPVVDSRGAKLKNQ